MSASTPYSPAMALVASISVWDGLNGCMCLKGAAGWRHWDKLLMRTFSLIEPNTGPQYTIARTNMGICIDEG